MNNHKAIKWQQPEEDGQSNVSDLLMKMCRIIRGFCGVRFFSFFKKTTPTTHKIFYFAKEINLSSEGTAFNLSHRNGFFVLEMPDHTEQMYVRMLLSIPLIPPPLKTEWN